MSCVRHAVGTAKYYPSQWGFCFFTKQQPSGVNFSTGNTSQAVHATLHTTVPLLTHLFMVKPLAHAPQTPVLKNCFR